MKKKLSTIIITVALTLFAALPVHAQEVSAQDMSQYYAMANYLMQMAMVMQAQAQQMGYMTTQVQQSPIYPAQPLQAVASPNPMDIQAQQATMAVQAQQALEAQQALQAQQALEAQQAQQMQEQLLAQQALEAQQALAIQQAQQRQAMLLAQQMPTQAPVQQVIADPTPSVAVGGVGNADNFDTYDESWRQNQTGIIVLNTKSMKYHNPWCDSVPKIAPENYAESTLSEAELQAQGYVRCKQSGDWYS